MKNEQDFNEWKKLKEAVDKIFYARLSSASSRQDAYRIEDEFQGVVSQRVVVRDPSLLSLGLMQELNSSINRLNLIGAQVEVVFDFSTGKDTSSDCLRGLLIAHASGIEEAVFSLGDLRARYGNSFYSG